MKKKECKDCKFFIKDGMGVMTEPCIIHPYYDRNRNGDCQDYKRLWYKFWIK